MDPFEPPVPALGPPWGANWCPVRAIALTELLLGSATPHPMGSAENRLVKERIVSWLIEHGLKVEVQGEWGCSEGWGRCAYVENIVAILPGASDGPYLALMAHYDSVPEGPGASDDGAAVAAILEIARMLTEEPQPRHDVVLRLQKGVFALYAHLRAGSVAVHEGQMVERGQLIGQIGNDLVA